MRKQFKKEHYYEGYDCKARFISYWNQINEVVNCNPKTVLEVGKGNGLVSYYLKKRGIDVTTADINDSLDPDYVENVTSLTNTFDKNSFDIVLCAEVLEHLPFSSFPKSIAELKKATRDKVILSLPHFGIDLDITFRISPIINWEFSLPIKIPLPVSHKFDGNHYWEIGKKEYPLRRVKSIIKEYMTIRKDYVIPGNIHHHLFLLEK